MPLAAPISASNLVAEPAPAAQEQPETAEIAAPVAAASESDVPKGGTVAPLLYKVTPKWRTLAAPHLTQLITAACDDYYNEALLLVRLLRPRVMTAGRCYD